MPESISSSIPVSSRVKRKAFQQGETRIERNKRIRYARLPWDLLLDHDVKPEAKLVYAAIAGHAFQGNVAYIGQRLVSDITGFSPSKVNRLLKLLVPKYIEVRNDGVGRRSFYRLTSPVFGQKQGKQDVLISGPSGVPRFASVRSA